MSNNSPTWYAVYIDDPDKKNGPRALFFDEQEALQWGFDAALMYVDVVPVDVTQFILKDRGKSHSMSLTKVVKNE